MSNQQIDPRDVFIKCSIFVLVTTVTTRAIMEKVGNNDGRGCPDLSGPIIALIAYAITSFYLAYNAYKMFSVNMWTFVFLVALSMLSFAVFIAYIPFAIKLQNKSSSDTKCLDEMNKNIIGIADAVSNGILAIFAFYIVNMNK